MHIYIHTQIFPVMVLVIIPLLMSSLTTAAFGQQCQGGMEGRLNDQKGYSHRYYSTHGTFMYVLNSLQCNPTM